MNQVTRPARVEEDARLAAFDTPPEPGFDDIVQLARDACEAPVALVSLVAGDRQWSEARSGFPECQTDFDASVCAHALREADLLVIPDLSRDARTRTNPLVTGQPHLRFYAGSPLRTPGGEVLGSLCVIDHKPRPEGLTEREARSLRALATQVMAQLELRRSHAAQKRVLDQREALIRTQAAAAAARGSLDGVLRALVDGALSVLPQAEGASVQTVEGEELVRRATSGILADEAGQRIPLHGSLTGACLLSGEPRIVPEVLDGARTFSCILAPVMRAGAPVGVLKLRSGLPDAFGRADLMLAQVLAGMVSTALAEAGEAEALQEASRVEHRRRAIFDSAQDYAIVVMDLEGRVTDWNAGATNILGWDATEMHGRPADVFFTPEDRAAGIPAEEMYSALTEGRGIDERWHLRKDGSRFWANGEMMALRGEDGAAIGFVKILRDRTGQKLAAEAQRRQAELLQTVTDHAGQAIFQMDASGDITFANPAAERMFGWTARELEGRNLHETLHHSHPDGTPYPAEACAFVQALRHGRTMVEREDTFLRKDGTPVRVLATNAPVMVDGRIDSAVLTVSDVSERKAAEARLRASEERWRGLFQTMHEGFLIGELIRDSGGTAYDFRLLTVNSAFAAQSGLPPDAAGRTARELLPGIPQWLIDTYTRVVETNAPETFEIEVPELARTFEVRARREGPERFAALFLDVSARKRTEARQAALLELGDRLRDLGDRGAIVRIAAEVAAQVLDLSRAGYGSVNPERETIVVEEDWHTPGLASIAGTHGFRTYGSYIEALKRGETVVIDDASIDPRTAGDGETLAAVGARALVNIPVMEHGRFVGVTFMLSAEPRAWAQSDVDFLRGVADRTRAAVARVEAEEHQQLLNHELSHRMKNILAMVQAIASQTLRGATDIAAVSEVLGSRLIALGKAHDILLGGAAERAPLAAVVREGIGVQENASGRVRCSGPDVEVSGKAALALALMLHELTTNAVKYGALSVPDGHVDLDWSVCQTGAERTLRISWCERGGPTVTPPARKGFGSRLIERGLTGQVGGVLRLSYPPDGVTCVVEAPLRNFESE
ncbi:MAG: PAS domain S-box protein [Hyphomicrobiales bacterium]